MFLIKSVYPKHYITIVVGESVFFTVFNQYVLTKNCVAIFIFS